MICDSIRNRHLYAGIAPEIKMALDYCAKMFEEGFREGDDVLADNVTMKCHPVTTRPMEKLTWEAHHRAIDIHFVVDGGEKIGYADIRKLTVTEDHPEEDYMLLEGDGDFLTLEPGYFVITFPEDAHAPSMTDGEPKTYNKIVAKIFL